MEKDKLMLIDGNSIMNRAFYGLQGSQLLATSDGLYTNAVFGFINIINKYMDEVKPGYICVAFDLKAPTFRHKEYEKYKAQRKGMPSELAVQMPLIKEVLDAMDIKRLEIEGYEADDILGHVACNAERSGMEVVIVTGDRDSLQLATNNIRIKIPVTKGGKTETEEYDENTVFEKYGVTPTQFIDVKGLMGDTSDNIPGVPGVGEKTALDLIKKFGSIEALYENIDAVDKKGVKEKLISGKELAFISKRLATIECNIPWNIKVEELKSGSFDRERLYNLFKKLQFKSLIEKFKLGDRDEPDNSKKSGEMKTKIYSSGGDSVVKLSGLLGKSGCISLFPLLDKKGDYNSILAGIGFSTGTEDAYYIGINENYSEKAFLTDFRELLESVQIKKIGHDIKHLFVYLKKNGINPEGFEFDTMIGAYLMNPTRESYSVAELSEEYFGETIDPVEVLSGKGKGHVFYSDMPLEKIGSVAGRHVVNIYRLYKKLAEILKENGQEGLFYDIELPLVEVLADMEYWGFKVNVEELKRLSVELEGKINELIKEIYEFAGEEFNINSTKQLGVILYEKLGLPILKKTKTGYSTDAEVLEQLSPRHEMIPKLLEYRQLVKLKSTYIEGLLGVISPETGKIHSSFNQTVTATGRISSTEPNLQNIPIKLEIGRKIRKVFIPSGEEFILADADYSQIELRVLAHITDDENMISAFNNNEDIHTSTASQVFGIPKSEVTSLMRSRAKAVNFGIVYGIGDFSLSKDLGITRKEARQYIDGYLDKYPGVRKYMHDIVEQGKSDGYVTTIFKRRRYLPELKSSNFNIRSFGERIAMNTPIQGSAADIIKVAMVNVYNELKKRKLKSRLILQVHDELIIETHVDEKEEVVKLLKECMENAVSLKAPLNVEVNTGVNWYETK